MQLVVIGSGTVAPSRERTAPAHWVAAGQTRLLLDCGAGTLHRAESLGIPWYEVSHVILSHFHVDHWGELPALLFALRWGIEPPRSAPLQIIGPGGLQSRLVMLGGALGQWVLDPGYPLTIVELKPEVPYQLAEGLELEAFETPHTEHSVAYAVRGKEGHLVYTGDTGPSDALAAWASGCDLLLAECSLPDHRAIDIHLTPKLAGELGRAARAKKLVLTHFYPLFEDTDPAVVASQTFGAPVELAFDGARFHIGNDG
jgi:ribonuclease BN (tRNA processing enzyme)